MSGKKRFWLKVGVLITFFLMGWGSQNLAPERASLLGVGGCLAEDPGNIPITEGSLTIQQSSSGIQLFDNGSSRVGTIGNSFKGYRGIMNLNQATGISNNQGTLVNIDMAAKVAMPQLWVSLYLGGNKLRITNSDYSVSIGSQSFRGSSGIAALNQAAGNLNNQYTAVGLTVGKLQPIAKLPTILFKSQSGTSVITGLSSAQLNAVIASSGNDVTCRGNQKASANLQEGAFQDFCGIAALSLVAGNMNQVVSNVRVNVSR
jgi:hypothetical protein